MMEGVIAKPSRISPLAALYAANLLLGFHIFSVVYIFSTYLSAFTGERGVGLLYVGGSILSIASFLLIPQVLPRLGNYRTILFLTLIEMAFMGGLSLLEGGVAAALLFVGYLITFPLLLYSLDIFLEAYTGQNEMTGRVRGTFLTLSNTALILAPLAAGLLLTNGDYYKVFLFSFIFLIPFFVIILFRFKNFTDPIYPSLNLIPTLRCIHANRDVWAVFGAHFLLRFFFSWMVIYMPLYLHNYAGFSWSLIGIMLFVMLLPFVLLEIPAGRAADMRWGEKEMMIVGFAIMGFATLAIPFAGVASFAVFAMLLFLSRVGASLVEIMTESYFFKHVGSSDANTISCFRMLRPLAYVAGPLVGSAALFVVDMKYLFVLLSLIVFCGIFIAIKLKDSR